MLRRLLNKLFKPKNVWTVKTKIFKGPIEVTGIFIDQNDKSPIAEVEACFAHEDDNGLIYLNLDNRTASMIRNPNAGSFKIH